MALHLSVPRRQELAASLVWHPGSSLPRLRLLSPLFPPPSLPLPSFRPCAQACPVALVLVAPLA